MQIRMMAVNLYNGRLLLVVHALLGWNNARLNSSELFLRGAVYWAEPDKDSRKNMTLTIIIPVLNERQALPQNLQALLSDSTVQELIVIDGGSTDGTRQYLSSVKGHPKLQVLYSAPGRGLQMNLGASVAHGDWLLFHHADSMLPDRVGDLIDQLDEASRWGGFSHQFDPGNWKLRLVSALHNWRCKKTGVIYGDQSMFVRRELFQCVGGFVEEGLEDLVFSDRALEHAPSKLISAKVKTSSRKFIQIGEFRALLQVLSIIWRYQRATEVGHAGFFQPYR